MSAEFIAEQGVLKGLILSLEEGDEWVIGRDPDQCSIIVEDPTVSRRHLICRKEGDLYTIENLSDSNPTLFNDQPVTDATTLHAGDRVKIGDTIFRFYPEGFIGDTYLFEEEGVFSDENKIKDEEKPEEILEETTPDVEPASFLDEPLSNLEEDTIFDEIENEEVQIDLTETSRFILKVISGPNTGAEFALDLDKQYTIGTDTVTCDIVFNDLSVSREHARLYASKEGILSIEDLNSRNGVFVEREKIIERKLLHPNEMIALGTSVFIIIDREAPAETIATPLYEAEEKKEESSLKASLKETVVPKKTKPPISFGPLILGLIILCLVALLGFGAISLFNTKEVEYAKPDYLNEIQTIIKRYPAVRFTYNTANGKLFLVGHVSTGIEHNELLYQLRSLTFIKGIEDNIVNDEAVWQEMNILLSKHPEFKGVSMHSPQPGTFVLNGYLQTEKQASDLTDYINVHFNYINLLQNRVVVEQQVIEETTSALYSQGYGAVNVAFSNGELQLTGYISTTQTEKFNSLLADLGKIPGVRGVKNFVVALNVEQGVIDLSKRYPGRYVVTGYSKHGDVNVNVVINGKILTRGETLDGFTITSIQPHTIFLEKEGLKYKIEYNR